MAGTLKAGSAQIDISPRDSQFLFGYPHVKRYSTGIHDPLLSSALYISDGKTQVMFIANDIIFVSKTIVRNARKRIEKTTNVPAANIMISATHTHSGSITVDYISNEADPAVPKVDKNYVTFMEDSIVKAAQKAFSEAKSAKIGFAIADDTGVGTNRREPSGPADHNVPVLMVKNAQNDNNIACMLVCTMHPTVLHEDSTLVSSDFPGLSRIYLQEHALGKDCPILHHTGPCGNQSPRHVTKANTFEEAKRLGEILAKAVEKTLPKMRFADKFEIGVKQKLLDDLPRRDFPTDEQAKIKLNKAIEKLQTLRDTNAPKQQIRTAECDWFGAEETLTLARAAADQRLEKAYQISLPAEIQIIGIGDCKFVGWQGEIFIEYSLALKEKAENTFVISMANGELQGYIVTEQAAKEGSYEASNALFSYKTGEMLVNETLKLLK